jgi:large subunit ribosomal protein L23
MSVLKRPLITEKATKAGEALGQYGFLVDLRANKIQIKQAVEKMYNVSVASVNTLKYYNKVKVKQTTKGIASGGKGQFKKAVVKLKKGETIDFYSSI